MKIKNHTDENFGGVYKITNTVNKKVYIGSTVSFKKRLLQHTNNLIKNKHHNKHLQASWNKYGSSVFVFEILEIVHGNKLKRTSHEQKYLNELLKNNKWNNCFNFQKITIQKDGNIPNLKDYKRKQSMLKKAFYNTSKGKMILENLAEKRRGKTYEEYYGSVEKAEQIKQKIRANKLVEMNKLEVKQNLSKQLKGKSFKERFGKEKTEVILNKMSKSRKGKYTGKDNPRFKIYKDIILISPTGDVYTEVEGVKNFAIQHNLRPNHLCELLKGKRKTCSGWIIKKE